MRQLSYAAALALLTSTFSLEAVLASAGRDGPLSLDCTVKGGPSDGAQILVRIVPASKHVVLTGLESIGMTDVAISDGAPPEAVPRPRNPDEDRLEYHVGEARHDKLYDGRIPETRGYVRVSHPIIEFGFTTRLPGLPNDPDPRRRETLTGPTSNFTIDRRTGAMRFRYAGYLLNASCAPQKAPQVF